MDREINIQTRCIKTISGDRWGLFGSFGDDDFDRFAWPMNSEDSGVSLKRPPTATEVGAFYEYLLNPSDQSKYPPLPSDQ